MFATKNVDFSCAGALRIKHVSEDNLGVYETISLGGKDKDGSEKMKWQNIRSGFKVLKTNIVVSMQAEGNCCWEYYAGERFRGEVADVVGEHTPEFGPISVKKKGCEYEYYEYHDD